MILRRSFFGYRRADVDRVVDQLERMAGSVERLWLEREALSRGLADAREEITRLRATEQTRLVQAEADARATAARVVAHAEEQAFEIRRRLGAEATDATSRLDELLRARERLLEELGSVVEQAQSALTATRAPAAQATEVQESRRMLHVAHADADRLFAPAVVLDVGPFDDYAALSSFERSLGALPAVRDVYIRRFDSTRALIELVLADRRPLLTDLSRHVPYVLHVREATDAQLTLDVETLSLAAAD